MKKEIHFGIMCSGMSLAKWQADAVSKMLSIEGVHLSLLIIEDKANVSRKKRIVKKLTTIRTLFWTAFSNSRNYKSTKPVDCSKIFDRIEKVNCKVELKGRFSQYFSQEDLNHINSKRLDFIIKFGFGIIRGDILNAAKYGVWSFHHDDETKYRGGPACFWEIYNGDKYTGAILQRLTNTLDGGIVLKKGYLRTIFSYVRNKDQLYFETSNWPAQLCIDIKNNVTQVFNNKPSSTKAPIYYAPNNWQFIKYVIKSNYYLFNKLVKNHLYVDYWNIGVVKAPISEFLNSENPSVDWFPLKTKDRFIADPFAIADKENKNLLHIFVETYEYKDKRGYLQYISYENGKGFSDPKTVIEKSTHLSYPYIIKHDENIYILPENLENNIIQLHKAKHFPLEWKEDIILKNDFAGVDNTIIKKDKIYWMFTSNSKDGSSYKLNLFYSDTLLSNNWEAHPQNPVKIDIRSSRCAGTPFIHNDELYRPSMDYSEKIEGRITINRITVLTKKEYKEEMVKIVDPYDKSYFSDKIHTLCSAGDYTIIDGAKEAFVLSNLNFLKSKF